MPDIDDALAVSSRTHTMIKADLESNAMTLHLPRPRDGPSGEAAPPSESSGRGVKGPSGGGATVSDATSGAESAAASGAVMARIHDR
ncbi:hypothetical protein [Sphaerisporangium rhizosphaerae]|uniref:Uncharacterized protein n=1 Tax=Sphaerisporangium rhizosphaerae TaxID=2269375 RepID=A0ABW2P7B5_9ACTN